jgi:hypothetical protein
MLVTWTYYQLCNSFWAEKNTHRFFTPKKKGGDGKTLPCHGYMVPGHPTLGHGTPPKTDPINMIDIGS